MSGDFPIKIGLQSLSGWKPFLWIMKLLIPKISRKTLSLMVIEIRYMSFYIYKAEQIPGNGIGEKLEGSTVHYFGQTHLNSSSARLCKIVNKDEAEVCCGSGV